MSIDLNNVVDVQVELLKTQSVTTSYDLGLIIGKSTILEDRLKEYSNTQQMLDDGFTETSPEYIAAQLYFMQNPSPHSVLIAKYTQGSETEAQAIIDCRNKNSDWYAACFSSSVEQANIIEVAKAVEAFAVPTILFSYTQDAKCLTETDNVIKQLQALELSRTISIYEDKGNYENVAAYMGRALGLSDDTSNSAFTLAFKTIAGINTIDITQAQLNILTSYNGNAYVTYGKNYNSFVPGVMANGTYYDEQYMMDVLKTSIQQNVINTLVMNKKVPQTEDGVTLLINSISSSCELLKDIGFIAPGIWKGNSVLDLKTGDALQNGYLIQSESIASQSQTDRESRKSPAIYVCCKLAGAIQEVTIRVTINR